MSITGSSIIANWLRDNKINKVFVYPGGTIAPLLDSLVKENIRLICTKNEQGAGYAAIGAAKVSGNPQVVIVTSGPGATNVITPVADAFYDSIPLVVFTGQVATASINRDKKLRQTGFQETDIVSMVRPVVKESFTLLPTDSIKEKITEAFHTAVSDRPGPVLIDLPMDTQQLSYDAACKGHNQNHISGVSSDTGTIPSVSILKDLLQQSKRPIVIAGNGLYISKATDDFRTFIDKVKIPVVSSLPAVGVLPKDHDLYFSFLGHTGEFYANLAVYYSDLILVFGSRLDIRQTGTRTDIFDNKQIVRVDIDLNEITYSRIKSNSEITFHMDLKDFFTEAKKLHYPQLDFGDWLSTIRDWQARYNSEQFYNEPDKLLKYDIVSHVSRLTQGLRVAVSTGVGSHQQITARYFDFDYPNRLWLSSCGHGTMGFDLPSVIGALIEGNNLDFGIVFVGDGSLQMNIQELATVKEYNLPVKIFVLDDNRLSLVSQFQLLNWKSDPTTGNKHNPDFADIARAYGLESIKIFSKDELVKLDDVFRDKLPTLIHCHVSKKEDVLPMLLANQEMNEMYPFKKVTI